MITFLFVPKVWKRTLFTLQKSSDFPGGRLWLLACQSRKIHGASSFSRETYLQFWNVARSELLDIFFKQHPHHHQTSKQNNDDDEGKEGWLYGTAGGSDARI
jgi:hypothetical protein